MRSNVHTVERTYRIFFPYVIRHLADRRGIPTVTGDRTDTSAATCIPASENKTRIDSMLMKSSTCKKPHGWHVLGLLLRVRRSHSLLYPCLGWYSWFVNCWLASPLSRLREGMPFGSRPYASTPIPYLTNHHTTNTRVCIRGQMLACTLLAERGQRTPRATSCLGNVHECHVMLCLNHQTSTVTGQQHRTRCPRRPFGVCSSRRSPTKYS